MDDKEFRLQRHMKMWEEQSRFVKRLIIAGLLFSILIPIKVLNPFVQTFEDSSLVEKRIVELRQEQQETAELNESLVRLQTVLGEVQKTIEAQPWMEKKDKLIETLSNIRQRSDHGGSWPEYQEAADSTIRRINGQVQELIIQPLEGVFQQNAETREAMAELSRGLKTLQNEMDRWEQNHVGIRWYETFFMKDREMRELTNSLQHRLNGISTITRSELSRVQTQQQKLAQVNIKYDQDIRSREDELVGLNDELQKLLPEWLRGYLHVEQMIQLFPLLILGLAIYITYTALTLSSHYEHIVGSVGLPEKYRTDPLTSSVWTLTYRGLAGTIATMITYLFVTLALWYFFEWGNNLLERWLTVDSDVGWVQYFGGTLTIQWVGRLLFLAVLGVYIFTPQYRKKRLSATGGI